MLLVLQIDDNGVFFDIAFFEDFINNLVFGKRAVLLKNTANDVFHNAACVSPFGQSIESPSDKNESRVFYKLIVSCRDVSLFAEKFFNGFGNLRKVNRRPMLSNNQKSVISNTFGAHIGRTHKSPLA